MALNAGDKPESIEARAASAEPGAGNTGAAPGGGSPAWIVPAYVAGLVLLYLGQRVFVDTDKLALVCSGLGLGALIAATAMRFAPQYQASGDRARVERLLGILSLLGILAVALYFASSDWGLDRIGFANAAHETRESAQGLLQIAWVVLLSVSVVPMLFAETALRPMRQSPHLESRRVVAAAISGATLAVAASYGAFFVYAASRTEVQADFSYFKTSEPGEATIKMVQSLDAPLRVTAFFPEVNEVRREVAGYFSKLAKASPNVEFAVFDRYLEPKKAQELKVAADGTIVLEKGEAKKVLTLGADIATVQPKLKSLDRDIQETLYKIIRSQRTAFITVGHGELNDEKRGVNRDEGRDASLIKQILQKQNYTVRNLGLAEGLGSKIPDDASLVLILGPLDPFAPEEIAALKEYVDRGGALFIAMDTDAFENNEAALGAANPAAKPGTPKAVDAKDKKTEIKAAKAEEKEPATEDGAEPSATSDSATATAAIESMKKIADLVGLTLEPAVLANPQRHLQRRGNDSDNVIIPTNRFSSHASVSTLSRNSAQANVVVVGASSFNKAPHASSERIDFTVKSPVGTFADLNRNFKQEKETERDTVYNLGAAVAKTIEQPKDQAAGEAPDSTGSAGAAGAAGSDEQKKSDKPTPQEMRAFVLADADAVSDLVLANFQANQMLVFDAVRWLGGEESFAGAINSEEDVRIEHSKQKDLVWFYATILGVPALVLGGGLGYSRRARRSRSEKHKASKTAGQASGDEKKGEGN